MKNVNVNVRPFELKSDAPVTPGLGNVYTMFGLSMGQTGRQTDGRAKRVKIRPRNN